MKKIVYIHIGSPKTATTSIQNLLCYHREKIIVHDRILYPDSGRNYTTHHPLAADLREQFEGEKVGDYCFGNVERRTSWNDLVNELSTKDEFFDSAIISSEDFYLLRNSESLEYIKRKLNRYTIKIVIYLRRQEELYDSLYNQGIKARLETYDNPEDVFKLDSALANNYYEVLNLWSSVFGPDNLIVRSFEKKQLVQCDIIHDFRSITGLNYVIPNDFRLNERLSFEELTIKKELNRLFDDRFACKDYFSRITRLALSPKERYGILVPKEEFYKYKEESIKINDNILSEFLNGNPLFLNVSQEYNFVEFDRLELERFIGVLIKSKDEICNDKNDEIIFDSLVKNLVRKYDCYDIFEINMGNDIKMKKVFFHIGTGKTGTSSIQNVLAHNSNDGFIYPLSFLREDSHFGEKLIAHYNLNQGVIERDISPLITEINNSNHDTFIISCENLYHHMDADDINYLQAMFKSFDCKIICYVRRQDEYLESAYKQQVKVGEFKMEFLDYIQDHINDSCAHKGFANYLEMLKPWEKAFGLENIILRKFEKNSFVNGNLINDFEYATGIKLKRRIERNVNEALSIDLIRVVRFFNESDAIGQSNRENFVNMIKPFFDNNDVRTMLPMQTRLSLLSVYENINQQLFDKYQMENFDMNIKEREVYGESNLLETNESLIYKVLSKILNR